MEKPKIIVVGSGFEGISALQQMEDKGSVLIVANESKNIGDPEPFPITNPYKDLQPIITMPSLTKKKRNSNYTKPKKKRKKNK